MRSPRSVLALLLAIPLAVGAVAAAASPAAAARAALPSFETCNDLVDFGRSATVRPPVPVRAFGGAYYYGTGSLINPRASRPEPKPVPPGTTPIPPGVPMPVPAVAAKPGESITDSAAGGVDLRGEEDFSGSNVQEQGIDEPDAFKTDGKRLFVVLGAELWAYDVTGPTPKLVSKLSLEGAGGEILLYGDRILVLGPQPKAAATPTRTIGPVAPPVPVPPPSNASVPAPQASPTTRLAEVDARNPAAMKIVRTMAVPGTVVSARLTRGTIRVVMSSPARLPTTSEPVAAGTPPAAAHAASAPKLGMRSFVPRTTLSSRRTKRTFRRYLVPCGDIRHPRAFAGSDLLTVLSVDFDNGLFNVDRDAVLAGAQVVYASSDRLYVASTKSLDIDAPADIPRRMVTEIHAFDTTRDGETSYAGSGAVPGFVLNQYALSEYQGDLRVATTEVPAWVPGAMAADSQSHVTVLRPDGKVLKQVGQVSGLGKGERIYATRFIGDMGYVVTFRQVDPLYTVDLRDPTAPKVAGELKISGYSAYLHPIGDDLLLGVGRDTDPSGWGTGAQVSVFDVKNPAAPARRSQRMLGNGGLAAEFDPHAFLWWPKTSLALLPYSGWDRQTHTSAAAVVGITATRASLAEAGRITHGPGWDRGDVIRSVIVGTRVFTLSELGIATSDLSGLGPVDFQAFVAAG